MEASAARIHHLNCATMCPFGKRLVNGEGGFFENARIVCHVLLIEGADGLTLVDTGLGSGDIEKPRQLAIPLRLALRPRLEQSETAAAQVRALGFDPADVRHIVVTHLDFDHAGGLPDFPEAQVHVFGREQEAATKPKLLERSRYIPNHTKHGPKWVTYTVEGDEWLGFESVRVLPGDPEVLMIPLPGHTRGHSGVAVRRGDGWLLHCGDAFFDRHEVETPPSCAPALRVFRTLTEVNRRLRVQNLERLRELARSHAGEVELINAHDHVLLDRAQAAAPAATAA